MSTQPIVSMLVLSTAHVSNETARKLDDDCAGVHSILLPVVYPKGEYGWIIPIYDIPEGCPADLAHVLRYAMDRGCAWLMFDNDAADVNGLPLFDW